MGLATGIGADQIGGNSVTRDGPQKVMRPASLAEWQAVGGGIPVPDYYWRYTEASGNVVDDVQGVAMTPSAAPLYGQAVTNWSSKGVGTVAGTTSQGFGMAGGVGWNVSTQSVFSIDYVLLASAAASTKVVSFFTGSTNQTGYEVTTAGKVVLMPGTVTGTVNYFDSLIHPHVFEFIGGAGMTGHTGPGLLRLSTDKEQLTGVWAATPDGAKGIGYSGSTGIVPPTATFNARAVWVGTKAEALSTMGPKAVLSQLGWAVSGY